MKNFLYRNIKRILRLWFTFKMVEWMRFYRLHNRDARIVVLMRPEFRSIMKDTFEPDITLIAVMTKIGLPFRVYRGNNFGQFFGKVIVYNGSYLINKPGFVNYTAYQTHIMQQLEAQGNKVFPRACEIEYWENKEFMYRKFKELGVRHPETYIFHSFEEMEKSGLAFPLLIKEAHSHASKGLHKVNNMDEARALLTTEKYWQTNRCIIAQKLLNMHTDFRVTIIGNEVVLHYWRTNPDKEWKPTATSHGSNVDFVTFPEKWRQYFIDVMKRLNLDTGGFDFAWENDDYETEPYCLEVSPIYQPNPPTEMTGRGYTYGQWKKKLLLRDSWDEAYNLCYFDLRYKYFKMVFEREEVLN